MGTHLCIRKGADTLASGRLPSVVLLFSAVSTMALVQPIPPVVVLHYSMADGLRAAQPPAIVPPMSCLCPRHFLWVISVSGCVSVA